MDQSVLISCLNRGRLSQVVIHRVAAETRLQFEAPYPTDAFVRIPAASRKPTHLQHRTMNWLANTIAAKTASRLSIDSWRRGRCRERTFPGQATARISRSQYRNDRRGANPLIAERRQTRRRAGPSL